MDNKGALTQTQIIELGILLITIGIILLFIFVFPWTREIDKDTCHQTIVMRSSFNFKLAELGKKIVPLKCKTEKICLSMSGKDCEEFGASTKDYPVTKIRVKSENDVKDAIADALYDCHSMLGEGKLDFMNREFDNKKYCLICSRIAFDKEARDKLADIPYGEIYRTLQEKKDNNEKSYLEYIYPTWRRWEDSKKIFEKMQKESDNADFKNLKFSDWKMQIKNSEKGYAVISAMIEEGTWKSWLIAGGTVAVVTSGAILTASGVGAPVGIGLIIGSAKVGLIGGGAALAYTHPSGEQGEYVYVSPLLVPYNFQNLKEISCGSFDITP